MKVLCTGAAGFIGRYVVRALQSAGHEVIGLDTIYPTGMPCEWIVADIAQPLKRVPGLEGVIHLAAVANPRACDSDPARAFTINVNGTNQVLKMAHESGARKVVFSSSAHVYSIPPLYLPTDEMHPLRLNNTYTTSKILGEQLCQLYFENHGLSYTVLRLFNAYGLGQGPGYFIPDQISKAKMGTISLSGGSTTKDWVYVTDVADAFVKAISSSFVGPLNIGTGKDIPLWSIAEFIAHNVGAEFSYSISPTDTRMQADNIRAKRILGWEPTRDIWGGLRAILDAIEVRTTIPA